MSLFRNEDTFFYGLLLFFGVALYAGLYLAPNPGPQLLQAIEIDMADVPDNSGRDIPVPRRQRNTPEPVQAEPMRVAAAPAIPKISTQKILADVSGVPAMPHGTLGHNLAAPVATVSASAADAMAGFMTQKDYYELLKMRVDALKRYPAAAKKDELQGEVVVRFDLDAKGKATAIMIYKSCGKACLDDAAIQAVRRAVPFPCPPSGFFKFPLRLQLAIQFMLT
ncbi:MAG: energy transducer TonB [Desulfovibrio sp.]